MKNLPSSSSKPTVRSAFTLIETLVVISILALLMALLIPAVSSMRQRGYASKSIHNLRQMSIGLQLLITEGPPGKDNFPGAFPSYAGLDNNLVAYTWPDLVGLHLGYVDRSPSGYVWKEAPENTVFQSPFRKEAFDPSNHDTCAATSGYGYNYAGLGEWSSPTHHLKEGLEKGHMNAFRLPNPEQTVVVAESDGNGTWDHITWPDWSAAGVSDAYNGGGHYLFADWHVEFLDKSEVISNHDKYYNPIANQ